MAALIENRVTVKTQIETIILVSSAETLGRSQENSFLFFFFFSSKKETHIYVMGEDDPVEKKRSIDDRGENGVSFTSTRWWEFHL